MRVDVKTKSSNYSDSTGNYKKITTSRTVKVSIGDIVGAAKTSKEAYNALKRRASDPMIAKSAVKALISPLLAFASTIDAIKKTVAVAEKVTTVITMAARSSGVWAAPGNVGEMFRLAMGNVTKFLVAMALDALVLLKDFIWNYEIDLGTISSSTLIKLSSKITNNGNTINSIIEEKLNDLNSLAIKTSYNETDINKPISDLYPPSTSATSSLPTGLTYTNSFLPSANEINVKKTTSPKGYNTLPIASNLKGDTQFKIFSDELTAMLLPLARAYITSNISSFNAALTKAEMDNQQNIIYNTITKPNTNNYFYSNTESPIDIGIPSLNKEISPLKYIIGNESIFKVHKNESVIDWENKVGMHPIIPVTINDLIHYNNDEITYNYDYNNIVNSETYSDFIKEAKSFLNLKLSIMKKNITELINETDEDITDLLAEEDLSNYKTLLDLKDSFINSQKIASQEIVNSYLEDILNLSEYQIKELLLIAIYESTINFNTQLRTSLYNINSLLINNEISEAEAITLINNSNYYFDVSFGVNVAFYNYLKAISDNTKMLNSSNDDDLITLAADFYKQKERRDLINELYNKTNVIPLYAPENISSLITINEGNLYMDLISFLNSSSWNTTEELYELIKNYISQYTINIIIDPTMKDRLNIILLKAEEYYKKQIYSIKNNLSFKVFDSVIDDFDNRNLNEVLKVYDYLEEIHNKFKSRINELCYLSISQISEEIKTKEINDIINKLNNIDNIYKSNLIKLLNLIILEFTDENKTEQINKIESILNDYYFSNPTYNIIRTEMFLYINMIKKYFNDNMGIL